MTVYVVNDGVHDYSRAKKWGKLTFLNKAIVSKYSVSKIYRMMALKLRESSPDDYILISGLTIMNCIACSCFAFLHKRLNLLIFKAGDYVERKIDMKELLSNEREQNEV